MIRALLRPLSVLALHLICDVAVISEMWAHVHWSVTMFVVIALLRFTVEDFNSSLVKIHRRLQRDLKWKACSQKQKGGGPA